MSLSRSTKAYSVNHLIPPGNSMVEDDHTKHWNKIYRTRRTNELGWYQEVPTPDLDLISRSAVHPESRILLVGAGATTLVDHLLELDFSNLMVNDVSIRALEKLRKRTGDRIGEVEWIVDDVVNPSRLNLLESIDLWHDRALLHFFIEKRDRTRYFDLMRTLVKPEGHVILATFNREGATLCSGLPVYRYDRFMLQKLLGRDFELVHYTNYTYTMPSGSVRPYVYTLFRRIKR